MRLSPEEAEAVVKEVEEKKKRLKKAVVDHISISFQYMSKPLESSRFDFQLEQKDDVKPKDQEKQHPKKNQYDQTSCSICLNNFEEKDLLLQIRQCSHAFHSQCLED